MSATFPSITVTTGTETVQVTPSRVDLLRLERIDKVSSAKVFDEPSLDSIYRLAWLALQRVKAPIVAPFKDLAALSRDELNAGVDGLAEIAELEMGAGDDAGPKGSDPAPSTGV